MFQTTNPLRFNSQNPNADSDVPSLQQSEIRLKQANTLMSYVVYCCFSILLIVILATIALTVYAKITTVPVIHDHGVCGVPGNNQDQTYVVQTETYSEIFTPRDSSTHQPVEIETTYTKREEIVVQEPEIVIRKVPSRSDEDFDRITLSNCIDCLNYGVLEDYSRSDIKIAGDYVKNKISKAVLVDLAGDDDARLAKMEGFADRMARIPHLRQKIEEILALNATFGQSLAEAESKTISNKFLFILIKRI